VQITLLAIGKTQSTWIAEGTQVYVDRLKHYGKFVFVETADAKLRQTKKDPATVQAAEAEILEKHLNGVDHLVLLDERGKASTSMQFADQLRKLQNRGLRHVMFVIGGPYGFSESIRQRADAFMSLGPMTFSHQMIRAFAAEQIYRAHTILKGEPYHHE
jgi:23S rRNA (pseudouridine1915-N3)-methyltransferase